MDRRGGRGSVGRLCSHLTPVRLPGKFLPLRAARSDNRSMGTHGDLCCLRFLRPQHAGSHADESPCQNAGCGPADDYRQRAPAGRSNSELQRPAVGR